jgi:L-rhamnose mutarotase
VAMEHRAYLMRLKKNRIEDYVESHKKDKIWDSVINGLKNAGFSKMIIFRYGQEIILFEVAHNLKNAYDYLTTDAESMRWDKMISNWMEDYPEYDPIKGLIEFKEIPVVFYYDEGFLLHT